MLPRINFTETQAWQYLSDHFAEIGDVSMRDMFKKDRERFNKFSVVFEDILLDYSKNCINDKTIALLMQLAKECGLQEAIEAMFRGEKINETEDRPVLHIALRNQSNTPILAGGKDVMPQVNAVLQQMKTFSNAVISGEWKGIVVEL